MAISDHQLKIGRLTILSPSTVSMEGGAGAVNKTISLNGTLAVDDLDDAKYFRDELIAMSKMNIPVAFTYTGDITYRCIGCTGNQKLNRIVVLVLTPS